MALDGLTPDTAFTTAALDSYVRYLLNNKTQHSRELMFASLLAAGVIEP